MACRRGARGGVAVLQQHALFRPMTVFQNVAFGRRVRRFSRAGNGNSALPELRVDGQTGAT